MSEGTFWYTVTVQISMEDPEGGKAKKQKESYLVRAISVTDAEAKIVKEFEHTTINYRIVNVSESKIVEVIQ